MATLTIKPFTAGSPVSWQDENGALATGMVWAMGPRDVARSRWVSPDAGGSAVLVQVPVQRVDEVTVTLATQDWRAEPGEIGRLTNLADHIFGGGAIVHRHQGRRYGRTGNWHRAGCPQLDGSESAHTFGSFGARFEFVDRLLADWGGQREYWCTTCTTP